MVDFQVTTTAVGRPIDTRWLASKHGEDAGRPIQLDPSEFVSGTHYNIGGRTDNVVPSGVAVAKLANGLYGPYSSTIGTGGDVRRILAGFILDTEGVELGAVPASAKPTAALLVHGMIKPTALPVVAQRTTLGAAASVTGSFIYVTD